VKEVFSMGRYTVLTVFVAVSLTLMMGLALANDIKALELEKECVLFGRIANRNVMLYPASGSYSGIDFLPVAALPRMAELKGFEVLNNSTGDWYPLDTSDEGYFCANLSMGKYDLRGRDRHNQPYVIHSFAIPRGMAVNLGTFWVETHDPAVVSREGWASHLRGQGWVAYEEGLQAVAVNFEHTIDDDKAYAECEDWFSECHEEVYLAFEKIIIRR
jgi:hypothetical protein